MNSFISILSALAVIASLLMVVRSTSITNEAYNNNVPSPLLVGIELNPGPPKGMVRDLVQSAISSAGAALGAAVGKTKRSRTRKKKNKGTTPGRQNNSASSYGVSAPIATGTVSRNRTLGPLKNKVFTLPFNSSNIAVNTISSSQLVNFASSGFVSSGVGFMDLHPIGSDSTNQAGMFGAPISSIAKAFEQWRLTKLCIYYEPIVPSTTPGGLLLSYTRDPYEVGTLNYFTISSPNDNATAPVWTGFKIEVTQLDTSWKYCFNSAATTAADQRLTFPGTMLGTFIGATLPSAGEANTNGFLRMEGVVEFTGLSDSSDLQFRGTTLAEQCAFYKPNRSAVSSPPVLVRQDSIINNCTCTRCDSHL